MLLLVGLELASGLEPVAPMRALNMVARAAPMRHRVRRPMVSVVRTARMQPHRPAKGMRIE